MKRTPIWQYFEVAQTVIMILEIFIPWNQVQIHTKAYFFASNTVLNENVVFFFLVNKKNPTH